ncbi:hypothetical protein AN396_08580 [Candidatus Epulonipiscium fishelsonii]|uniref:Uncharacterized protein n=1 Tax=Candidatus Epulonipiscium fishelsonii TaxID=77094 RepID=A0ACC8XAU7_9FIRM|nr:hypothetical protein AN396_08580 [Epulopiscium sp. SCG-B11WGA-EpuloA1]
MKLQNIFKIKDEILLDRLENLMPKLMEETNIQMYIVVGDEYNEGPVVKTMLPSSLFHARRKAILIFTMIDGKYEKMVVSKPDFTIGTFYNPILLKPPGMNHEVFYKTFAKNYDIEKIKKMPIESEKDCITRIIKEKNPTNIALEFSTLTPFADGISKTNYDYILTCIEDEFKDRVISAEKISIRWLESRTLKEIEQYKKIVSLTRKIIGQCYSKEVITPNVTTIGEARFFLMEEAMRNFGTPWFDATIWINRDGKTHIEDDTAVIMEGDLLHCDYGFELCGLCSDVQEMAYVKGKDDAKLIKELGKIHEDAMIVQDSLAECFVLGKTGNEILASALALAKQRGVKRPMIYTHPIGYHGHGAGPTIGNFGNQEFVGGMGEYELHDNTFYAMELNVCDEVKEWNNLMIMYGQEIDIAVINGKVEFLGGRQINLHIIE